MTLFVWNLLLAVLWAAIHGSLTLASLLVGFAGGYIVLLLARPLLGSSAYYAGIWRAIWLVLFFVWELVRASLRVTWQVIMPMERLRPGIIAVPLELRSPNGITVFANMLSLVPGTLSLDLSADHRTLYVHVMHIPDADADAMRNVLRQHIERRVLSLLN